MFARSVEAPTVGRSSRTGPITCQIEVLIYRPYRYICTSFQSRLISSSFSPALQYFPRCYSIFWYSDSDRALLTPGEPCKKGSILILPSHFCHVKFWSLSLTCGPEFESHRSRNSGHRNQDEFQSQVCKFQGAIFRSAVDIAHIFLS